MNYLIDKIKKTFFLDTHEKFFKKSLKKNKKISNIHETENIILFNAAENYYDLCFAYLLSKEKNDITGLDIIIKILVINFNML